MSAGAARVDRVQDTARWVAMARAQESERKDALFKDPFARRLAGPVGDALLRQLSGRAGGTWPIVARTHIIDRLVASAVRDGADAVVNLAAGLDTRPLRMDLPASLTWIEVDHPDVVVDKEACLRDSEPACRLERVAQDLSVAAERQSLFAKIGVRFQRTLVLTEGLLCYLAPRDAMDLAKDIRSIHGVFRWIADLNNAAVNEYVARRTRHALQGTARMQFGPDHGPLVFEPLGWRTVGATSIFKSAGRLKRLPFPMSLFARLPEKPYGTPGRPWSGVCVWEPDGARP
jgi:methyltransferase (TIGR00027 family)